MTMDELKKKVKKEIALENRQIKFYSREFPGVANYHRGRMEVWRTIYKTICEM